jgi:hypothetical protein
MSTNEFRIQGIQWEKGKSEVVFVLYSVTCYDKYGKVELQLHTSDLALNGDEQSASRPSHLPQARNSIFPLAKRLPGPNSQSACCTEGKNFILFLPGIEPPLVINTIA